MAAQTNRFLRHRDLIGENRRLGQQALLIHRRVAQQFPHPGLNLIHMLLHGLGRAFLHLFHRVKDGLRPGENVLRIRAPSLSRMAINRGKGFVRHPADSGPDGLLVLRRAMDGQHIGKARQHSGCRIVRQAVFFGQLLQRVPIPLRQRVIHRHRAAGSVHRFNPDIYIHLAPGDGALDIRLQLVVQKPVRPGNPGGIFIIPVVDRFDLDGDIHPIDRLLIPAVAGHASHHAPNHAFPNSEPRTASSAPPFSGSILAGLRPGCQLRQPRRAPIRHN